LSEEEEEETKPICIYIKFYLR